MCVDRYPLILLVCLFQGIQGLPGLPGPRGKHGLQVRFYKTRATIYILCVLLSQMLQFMRIYCSYEYTSYFSPKLSCLFLFCFLNNSAFCQDFLSVLIYVVHTFSQLTNRL